MSIRSSFAPVPRRVVPAVVLAASMLAASGQAQVVTTVTTNEAALKAALNPIGLSIDAVTVLNGMPGQVGTFRNFDLRPVTIRPGIVLSSGNIENLTPFPEALDPNYDPAGPPAQVNSQMYPEPDSGGTPEFDFYGQSAGNIENFNAAYDVAAVRVDFTLEDDSPIKFDFIFGSVEYPFWTSQFTDSFLVFLDGTAPENQITFDANGSAVQVGSSFAGLETTNDVNTAFSEPHGLIHHLTTTSPLLGGGEHYLIFEVGDVNDHILDSVAFISNLRAEAGTDGTEPTDDDLYIGCPSFTTQPAAASTCASGSADFVAAATGYVPMSYRWQWREVGATGTWHELDEGTNTDSTGADRFIATGAHSTHLHLAPAASSSATLAVVRDVRCVAQNSCGDEPSNKAELFICMADFNCDGFVDFTDFDAFVTAFESGGSGGDFNADGFIDFTDFDGFVAAFELGC